MKSNEEESTRGQLDKAKQEILKQVRQALKNSGLQDFDIASLGLYLKHTPTMKCPDGQEPVWEAVTLPDGRIEYRWVCK